MDDKEPAPVEGASADPAAPAADPDAPAPDAAPADASDPSAGPGDAQPSDSSIAVTVSGGDGAGAAASGAADGAVELATPAAVSTPAAAGLAVASGVVDPAYADAATGANGAPAGAAGSGGSNNSLSKFIALAMTAQGSYTFKVAILIVVLSVLFASCYLNYWEIHLYTANYEANKLCERPLGMWLYVSGISGFVGLSLSTAGSIMVVIAKRTRDQIKIKSGVALHCLNQLNNLFGFVWMIYGSALVYAVDAHNTLCPAATYNFTWYFITSTWSVSGSVLFLAIVAAIATLCYRRYKGIGGTSYEFDDTLTTS